MSACVIRFNAPSVAIWAIVCLLAAAPSVDAADTRWRISTGGTFSNAGNWNNGVPGASDVAHFGLSTSGPFGDLFSYTVSFTADATNNALVIEDDRVIFDLNGHTYNTTSVLGAHIGTVSGSSGGLTVADGTLSLALGSDLAIGADSSGFLTVSTGGRVIGNPFLFVGGSGAGTLTVQNGGELLADDTLIGQSFGATGTATITATITGALSSLLTGQLTIGNFGPGALNITSGGRVASTDGDIGTQAGRMGTVNVNGTNSRWDNSVALTVGSGFDSDGTLNISGGGRVSSATGFIASGTGSTGTATIDGANSSWVTSGFMIVGVNGSGTLNISNNGDLIADQVTIGANSGSTGTATITGGGSSLLAAGLTVGGPGMGSLNVLAGGRVDSTSGRVGSDVNLATATVSDAGSKWMVSEELHVGFETRGSLSITNGGVVQDQRSIIGAFSGEQFGFAEVKGANSKWTHQRDFTIGGIAGNGTLSITDGGLVENIASDATVIVGDVSGGFGTVDVDGVGSRWINASDLTVGDSSEDNVVNITGGGFVQNADAILGNTSAGGVHDRGTVIVSDPGSEWNASSVVVGKQGIGTLKVLAGGRVEVGTRLAIAIEHLGDVSVDGHNSALVIGGDLNLALLGDAQLSITGGGLVENIASDARVIVGDSGGGFGTVNVDGVGSRWINASDLMVGDSSADNVVNITGGAFVQNADAILGNNTPGVVSDRGTVIVSGPGSQWNASSVVVGREGTGTLKVLAGGRVEVGTKLTIAHELLGDVSVDGQNSTLIVGGDLRVGGLLGDGQLNITGGGRVTSSTGTLGSDVGGTGDVVVSGAGSTWDITDNLVGAPSVGSGTVRIQIGGALNVANAISLHDGDELRLEGGALRARTIEFLGAQEPFFWSAGRLSVDEIQIDTLIYNAGNVLAPGRELGETFIDGDLLAEPGGVTEIQIGGTTPGVTFDRVRVTGSITIFNGVLEVSMLNGFVPTATDAFTVMSSLSSVFSGSFANIPSGQRLATVDGLGSFLVSYGPGSPQVVLSAFQPSLPGDYNQNGTVDAADYTVWRNNLGSSIALPNDDTAGVGPDDYTRWKANFGQTAGSGAGATAAVPEPASISLAAVSALILIAIRRRPSNWR